MINGNASAAMEVAERATPVRFNAPTNYNSSIYLVNAVKTGDYIPLGFAINSININQMT